MDKITYEKAFESAFMFFVTINIPLCILTLAVCFTVLIYYWWNRWTLTNILYILISSSREHDSCCFKNGKDIIPLSSGQSWSSEDSNWSVLRFPSVVVRYWCLVGNDSRILKTGSLRLVSSLWQVFSRVTNTIWFWTDCHLFLHKLCIVRNLTGQLPVSTVTAVV